MDATVVLPFFLMPDPCVWGPMAVLNFSSKAQLEASRSQTPILLGNVLNRTSRLTLLTTVGCALPMLRFSALLARPRWQ